MSTDLTGFLVSDLTYLYIQKPWAMVMQFLLCGHRKIEKSVDGGFLTGSCWNDAVAMGAALVSLRISKWDNVAEQVTDKGSFFAKGMEELTNKFDYPLKMTGPACHILGLMVMMICFSCKPCRLVQEKGCFSILITIGSLVMLTIRSPWEQL